MLVWYEADSARLRLSSLLITVGYLRSMCKTSTGSIDIDPACGSPASARAPLTPAPAALSPDVRGYRGNRQAAEELVRAGWAYAIAIDHRPLLAQLRLELAAIVYWQRPRLSRDLARSGLDYLSDGETAAMLHLRYGQAAARIGDADTARQAITAAHEARARDHHDDLIEIGGTFGLSRATQHFKAGTLFIEIPEGTREAIPEFEQAVGLYDAGPGPDEYHYHGYVSGSRADLATALLRDGQLDAATAVLELALTVSPERRGDSLLRRLERVRTELAAPRYRGQQQATELDERIETFSTETIVSDLATSAGTN
ncbi:MAG TPA: hypothetical protein VF069_18290 [Streptosporangiaceae bacterium]